MYLNADFLWHICTCCSIHITVSFICWCTTNHILKTRHLEWLKEITLTLLMNLQFGQVLVETLCFWPTGQLLGCLRSWGPESSSFNLHFRCLGLEPPTAGGWSSGGSQLHYLPVVSPGFFSSVADSGELYTSLVPQGYQECGEKRKTKRKITLGGNCVSSLLLSLSSHAASLRPLSVCGAGHKAGPGLRVEEMGFTSPWVKGKGLERQVRLAISWWLFFEK